jgi:hypothetical protein
MRRGRTCADRRWFGKIKLMHFQIGLLDYLHAANVSVSYVQPLHVIRTGLADHNHFHLKAHIPSSSKSRRSVKLIRYSDKKVFFDKWPITHRRHKCYDFHARTGCFTA